MTVASFWVYRPSHPLHRSYDECLRLQRASCERLGLRHLVLTDANQPWAITESDPPWAFHATQLPEGLMRAVLLAQIAYLRSDAFEADTVLVGADCLALHDPAPVFDGGFDIGITTHPFSDCILNTGTIFCPLAARAHLVRIWEDAVSGVGHRWGDDQLALAAVLRPTLEHGDHLRDGIRVRQFPVPGYNDAPRDEADMISPLFAHFRGRRKDWIGVWWRNFLAQA